MKSIADAWSRRPAVNAVSIAYHNDFINMKDVCAKDEDLYEIYTSLQEGKTDGPFSLKEGFLMHGNRLCVTKEIRPKMMVE